MIKPNMGLQINSSSHTSLSNALFSGTKKRVLGILFGQPNRSFYSNEIINLVSSGSGAVQRELASLANSGLVTVKLKPLASQITAAFVYGSVAKKTDTASSDIDLMLISDEISYGELFSLLENTSHLLGRPVNPTILSKEEFNQRHTNQEAFLTRILKQPKIWLIGERYGAYRQNAIISAI